MFTIQYFLFNPSLSLANSLLYSCQTRNRFSCGWVGVVTILVWPVYGTAQTQLVNIFVWRMRQEKPHPSITILLSPQTQVQLWLSWGCDNLALLSVGQLPRLLKVKDVIRSTKGKTTWGSVLAGVSASPVVCAVSSRTMYRGKSISGCWCMRELRRINPISELGELFKNCRIPGT